MMPSDGFEKPLLQVGEYVTAESTFASICEMVGFDGYITKRVRKNFEKTRNMNLTIRDIQQTIGSTFPHEKFTDTARELRNVFGLFCMDILHSYVHEFSINQWGEVDAVVKWLPDHEEFLYYIDTEDVYENYEIDENAMREHLIFSKWKDSGFVLCDSLVNQNNLRHLAEAVPGISVETFTVGLEDSSFNQKRDLSVIKAFSVSISSFSGLIDWYETNKHKFLPKTEK